MTTQAKHTPGPWRVGDAGFTVFGPTTESPSPETVAYLIRTGSGIVASDKTKANARLIAAAPALLEALQDCADQLERWSDNVNGDDKPILAQARAAILSATVR